MTELSRGVPENYNARAQALGWPAVCEDMAEFDHPSLVGLNEVWMIESAQASGIPPRAAFDMRKLKPFLPHLSIIERIDFGRAHRYRFRLFGSEMVVTFGEATGRYLDELVPADHLPSWLAAFDSVLDQGAPLRFLTEYRLPNLEHLKGENFTAPMLDERGERRFILAATYVSHKVNTAAIHPARAAG
jgi:hypothetical protein